MRRIELYTNLVRLKQAMNGGSLPPMTPLSEAARKVVDPAFTIGMGALYEDPERGLRCPVRGCGGYFHELGQHVSHGHKAMGGVKGLRAALELPPSVSLVTAKAREARRARGNGAAGVAVMRSMIATRRKPNWVAAGAARRASTLSAGARNLRDRCDAQVGHKLIDLQHKIGRSPTTREAAAEYGSAFVMAVIRIYGTWNAAKGQFGLDANKGGGRPALPRDAALDVLRAWYEAHGDLPSCGDADARDSVPLLPHSRTLIRALGAEGWPQAMHRAARALGVVSARYSYQAEATTAA